MKNYKFKFKYSSKGLKASGKGTCKAEDIGDAFAVARKGVASDFGSSEGNVFIVQMSEYKPRKKKVKEQSS